MSQSTENEDFSQADDLIRDRQRYYPRTKKAQHFINQLLVRKAYGQQKSANELEDGWKDAVDKRWHAVTRVGNINRGVLEVFVSNSTMVQHLNFQKSKILTRLLERLPQNKISEIRFKVGPIR